jgi:hypothetical protein
VPRLGFAVHDRIRYLLASLTGREPSRNAPIGVVKLQATPPGETHGIAAGLRGHYASPESSM